MQIASQKALSTARPPGPIAWPQNFDACQIQPRQKTVCCTCWTCFGQGARIIRLLGWLLQVQPRVFVETNAPQIVAILEPGFSSRYQVSGAGPAISISQAQITWRAALAAPLRCKSRVLYLGVWHSFEKKSVTVLITLCTTTGNCSECSSNCAGGSGHDGEGADAHLQDVPPQPGRSQPGSGVPGRNVVIVWSGGILWLCMA